MQLDLSQAEVSRLKLAIHKREKEESRIEQAKKEIKEIYELLQVVS